MKAVIFAATFFMLFASCNKDVNNLSSGLQGTWELRSSFGGWSGAQEYPSGNGNTIQFSGNKYTQHVKSTDTSYSIEGSFIIYKDKPCDMVNETTLIKFDSNSLASEISVIDNELTLSTVCIVDGGSTTYKKTAE